MRIVKVSQYQTTLTTIKAAARLKTGGVKKTPEEVGPERSGGGEAAIAAAVLQLLVLQIITPVYAAAAAPELKAATVFVHVVAAELFILPYVEKVVVPNQYDEQMPADTASSLQTLLCA
jgi:hypothetical protein